MLSLVPNAKLSCKMNPLKRTEVPARYLLSFHFSDEVNVIRDLADLSCVFLNRARGNVRQGPWRYKILTMMRELLTGWGGIQIVTQA